MYFGGETQPMGNRTCVVKVIEMIDQYLAHHGQRIDKQYRIVMDGRNGIDLGYILHFPEQVGVKIKVTDNSGSTHTVFSYNGAMAKHRYGSCSLLSSEVDLNPILTRRHFDHNLGRARVSTFTNYRARLRTEQCRRAALRALSLPNNPCAIPEQRKFKNLFKCSTRQKKKKLPLKMIHRGK